MLHRFNVVLDVLDPNPIPEPASILLLTGGLAALGAAKFKHRRTVAEEELNSVDK